MERYLKVIIWIWFLMNSAPVSAQDGNSHYKNRICIGLGGEDGYLGIDYSREIYKSKLLLGVGCGFGTGWTAYLRYEPLNWRGFSPFISSGISHSFGGTLMVSPATSIFSASAGLNYVGKRKGMIVPVLGLGLTYYSILEGDAEGETNAFGPLIKFGFAFPGGQ